MLQLATMPAYWWPVEYVQPADGGLAHVQAFEAQYRQLDQDEMDALQQRARAENLADTDLAREVVLGFRQVADGQGADVPCTPDSLAALLRMPGMGTTLWFTYAKSRTEAALGNLPRRPVGGPPAAMPGSSTSTTVQ